MIDVTQLKKVMVLNWDKASKSCYLLIFIFKGEKKTFKESEDDPFFHWKEFDQFLIACPGKFQDNLVPNMVVSGFEICQSAGASI